MLLSVTVHAVDINSVTDAYVYAIGHRIDVDCFVAAAVVTGAVAPATVVSAAITALAMKIYQHWNMNFPLQYSTVQFSTGQISTVQLIPIWCSS